MIKARNLRPRDGLSANCREKSELCSADSEGSKVIVVYCRDCLREQARASKNIARSRGRVRLLVDAFHEGPRLPTEQSLTAQAYIDLTRTISIHRYAIERRAVVRRRSAPLRRSGIKRDEIAARQLHALRQHYAGKLKLIDVREMFMQMRGKVERVFNSPI
jgi:hypothetical protein